MLWDFPRCGWARDGKNFRTGKKAALPQSPALTRGRLGSLLVGLRIKHSPRCSRCGLDVSQDGQLLWESVHIMVDQKEQKRARTRD